MIIVPSSRWRSRPACAARPLRAAEAAAALAAAPVAAPIKWSSRPGCASRRLGAAPASVTALVPAPSPRSGGLRLAA